MRSSGGEEDRYRGRDLGDFVLGTALFVGTVVYAWTWPRDLVGFDEGLFVYESARIAEGEVPYRDFFEMVTPGAWYLLALLFRVFGTDMATARGMMAVVHGLIVLATFAACRRLAVRASISMSAAMFHMAAAYPSFTVATPHWISTLLALIAFHMALGQGRRPSRRRALALGVVGGCAIAVQQQKGLFLSAGLMLLVGLLEPAQGVRGETRLRRLAAFAGGVALVVVPGALYLLARAGAATVYRDLVLFPLTGYREFHAAVAWGQHYPGPVHHPFPRVIQGLPVVLGLLAARALVECALRREGGALGRDGLVGVFCLSTLLGALYNPDYTHLAMAAPPYAIAAADLLEWAIRRVLPRRSGVVAGLALSAILIGLLARPMRQTRELRRILYPVRGQTDFGTIDFMQPNELAQIEALRRLAREEPDSEVFIYPYHPAVYLMIGKRNPTAHQVVLKDYTRPEHVAEVIRTLEAKKVRYVAVLAQQRWRPIPELSRYVASRYRRVPLGAFDARRSPLYERVE